MTDEGFALDDEILQGFITESREHLATIEADLLAIEQAGESADPELVNKVFRAAHSIKGCSGFLGLNKVKELAHKAETVLDMLRSHKIHSNAEVTNVLLAAFDKLRDMVNSPLTSEEADTALEVQGLVDLAASFLPQTEKATVSPRASSWSRIRSSTLMLMFRPRTRTARSTLRLRLSPDRIGWGQ